MKIVIPDDYQDMVDQLECFSLIRHHDVTRYREPARDLEELVERLRDADVAVSIRERVEFSRALPAAASSAIAQIKDIPRIANPVMPAPAARGS